MSQTLYRNLTRAVSVAFFLSFCSVFSGCTPEDRHHGESPAVVTIDGVSLRLDELQGRANMMAQLHRHRFPDAPERLLQVIRRKYEAGYPKFWVEDAVLSRYAAAEGVKVSDELLAKYRKRAFAGLRAKGDRSFDDLLKVSGVSGDYLERQVAAEALRQAISDRLFAQNPTNIPDSYVDGQLQNISDYNARMTVTNAQVYARATNVWNRLKAGEDFVKLVHEETEVDDEKADDGQWGVFDLSAFDQEPGLKAALAALKPGEFTPPVEGDNGLMIARLNERDVTGGLDISRIIFRLPLFYKPAPREKILEAAYEKYRKSLFDRKLKELLENAVIEYEQNNATGKETK